MTGFGGFNRTGPGGLVRFLKQWSQVQKSMEVPLGESEPRFLTSVEGQVGASSSGAGSMLMSALGVQVTGKEATTQCSSDIVILDYGKADFPGFTDSNIE